MMKFIPEDIEVRGLLKWSAKFLIPPFQRDYSWDRQYYKKFIDDIIDNISVNEGKVIVEDYFIGTMVFSGLKTDDTVDVVDGQQRLTVITTLLSVISQKFQKLGNLDLTEATFSFIKTKDDYGKSVTKLTSNSSYPYFDAYIQSLDKSYAPNANTEEEENLKKTYDFFDDYLDAEKIKNQWRKFDEVPPIDIFIGIRDQILKSKLIAISTENKNNAYMIFEILNAKGKGLASIDLVKNLIFETFHDDESAKQEIAEQEWEKMKSVLRMGKSTAGVATFYRHFWISKYKKVTNTKLYDSFKQEFKPKTSENYINFLKELALEAEQYSKIMNPKIEDYGNRQEYNWLVQSLSAINDTFSIVQSRIIFLALMDIKKRNLIKQSQLKKAVEFIENFIFVHSAILKKQANIYEGNFSKIAIKLRKSQTKDQVKEILDKDLYGHFGSKFPRYDEFEKSFIEIEFSAKKKLYSNLVAKYIVKKINQSYDGANSFASDITVEHIISETSKNAITLKIGNLIGLERKINEAAGNEIYINKINEYKKSKFNQVIAFTEEYSDFDEDEIMTRGRKLAEYYYKNILKESF